MEKKYKVLCLRILVEEESVDAYGQEMETSEIASMGVVSLGLTVEDPSPSDLAQLPDENEFPCEE